MTISSMAGAAVVPVEDVRARLAFAALGCDEDLPVKRGFSCSLTSKSEPVGPREGRTETVAGMLSLGIAFLADFSVEKDSKAAAPSRSTSYPASTKRPSGGTKDSSPGLAFHWLSLTQG